MGTITWWGHRTHGATIGTVATSVTLAAARLTTAKQPQAIDCVAARFSRIVLRSSWLKKAAMQHLRPPLQLLLLRSWSLSQSLSLSLSQNQRRSQHHRHNQNRRRTLQKAVPARENLALILRIAAPNGALVVQAARTAMQNPLGHPRVAPRLTLPRAPALGSLAAMPLIADRNGVIVVRLPRTAMQIQLGQQTVACPFLRINTRSLRPAPCVAIGVSLARVSFRRAVNTYSVLAYPLRICEFSCAPLYRIEERERFSCVQSCLAQSLLNTMYHCRARPTVTPASVGQSTAAKSLQKKFFKDGRVRRHLR